MEKPPYALVLCGAVLLTLGCAGHFANLHDSVKRPDEIAALIDLAKSVPVDPSQKPRAKKPIGVRQAIVKEAISQGVPVKFAIAVATQESGLNPKATGGVGEIGLFQMKCGTAKMLGYKGNCRSLYNPELNAFWGTKHLKKALEISGGNLCGAATLHNRGLGSAPVATKYCRQVLARLK